MIHMRSKRRNQAFIKVNCAALPGELLESELFGFEQGAFTGADRAKPGKFEMANKGTIFLDEIAEMSTHLQAKLLHVLQDHQYSRLGGRHMVDTDVRVLAATNVDVQEAMKTGRFREDLYYRLNVLSIHVPPLRERATEIPLLFRHFLTSTARNSASRRWPFEALAGCGGELSVAGQFAGTGKFRQALRHSGRRRRQLPRIGGNVRARQRTSPRAEPGYRPARAGTQGAGPRSQRRSRDGSHCRRAGEDALVPQRRRENAGHQLQGVAIQDAAV